MSRESALIILGILVAVSPFVGLPLSVLAWILPVLGILTAIIGLALRLRRQRRETTPEPEPVPAPEPQNPLSY